MKLDELRARLEASPERGDPELLREMVETLNAAADGQLVDSQRERKRLFDRTASIWYH